MNIPDYITHKKNLVGLVVFTAIFALVFINIYKPFSSYNWYDVTEFLFFAYSSLIILTGMLVVMISRLLMYLHAKKNKISYWKYALWVFLEILFMSLFYTIFTLSADNGRDVMEVFKSSFINTTLVLLLPYTVHWLFLGWRENSRKLNEIAVGNMRSLLEGTSRISFNDEKGHLKISILLKDLLYIESCDNYANIHYLSKGTHKKFLLRNRLKNIEKELSDTNIVRCHRTLLVNLERAKVLKREKGEMTIELDEENTKNLPVSKSYREIISRKFTSGSKTQN
jgi:hypothetical protein